MIIQPLPGFRDFYPDELAVRNYIFAKWREEARRYGFREYDGPPLEPLELYTLKSGDEIVGQLYNFKDKGDRDVALRPEMTPTIVRMVAAREKQFKKPLKWFSIPQLFRYERQQRGRLREHFQLNCDIIGESGINADAELIACLADSLRSLGLTHEDFVVRVSDRLLWHGFLNALGVDEPQHEPVFAVIDKIGRVQADTIRSSLKHLGLADSQVESILKIAHPEGAEFDPTSLATSNAQLKERLEVFENFRQRIEALGLRDYVRPDFSIVRGLAYYTGIVFEAHDVRGQFRAIAGGGRYDNLLNLVSDGVVDLPALGFGMGDVVLTELLRERGKLQDIPEFEVRFEGLEHTVDCYMVVVDESLRLEALKLIHQLREMGFSVDYPLAAAKVGKQFQNASSLNARMAVIIGPHEWQHQEVKVKNMRSGEENIVPVLQLAAILATSK